MRLLPVVSAAFMFAAAATPALAVGAFPEAEAFMRGFCLTDNQDCAYNRETFPDDYAAAIGGDYQGQRNVAFCLETGCRGAVEVRPTLGCAWRKVILASGHFEITDTDIAAHRFACGQIDALAHGVAVNQAITMFLILTADSPIAFPPALVHQPSD